MTKVNDFQKISEIQQQISTQEIILQTKMLNNEIILIRIDFNKFSVSNFIDVLQKKIDEIAKRRRIILLRKTLRKIKIDQKVDF